MVTVVALVLAALVIAPSLASAYLLLLTVCSGIRKPAPPGTFRTRFDVIVPAHDEEGGIVATISSLQAIEYPRALYRIIVVVDNCHDRTAELARQAGASVLVRDDPEHAGKGRALAFAFERVIAEDRDAVVVIDADTIVSPNLLAAFDLHLQRGAKAVQCDYAVRNCGASWRTLLMAIALGSFHVLRSRGRERLKASCGLRGNGMCFAVPLLRDVRYDAFSIVEDLEYGIRLGEAGHRVVYAPETHVYGEMVTGEQASRSQRRRWEGGRARMRGRGWSMLAAAARRGDRVLLDLAIDVLLPPLSTLVLVVALGAGASCILASLGAGWAVRTDLALWGSCGACLLIYLIRGWQLSGTGARGLLSFVHVPGYVLWKLVLVLRRDRGRGSWVRTAREGGPGGPVPS
jgi:1,2-diacylglycerol 3-beta-glucosyltransferase